MICFLQSPSRIDVCFVVFDALYAQFFYVWLLYVSITPCLLVHVPLCVVYLFPLRESMTIELLLDGQYVAL